MFQLNTFQIKDTVDNGSSHEQRWTLLIYLLLIADFRTTQKQPPWSISTNIVQIKVHSLWRQRNRFQYLGLLVSKKVFNYSRIDGTTESLIDNIFHKGEIISSKSIVDFIDHCMQIVVAKFRKLKTMFKQLPATRNISNENKKHFNHSLAKETWYEVFSKTLSDVSFETFLF